MFSPQVRHRSCHKPAAAPLPDSGKIGVFQFVERFFIMSMADRDGVIWYDGKLVPWRDATTHVLTHTLHYGMGVFEGVRAYKAEQGTAIFRCRNTPTGCSAPPTSSA
jgi:hypothetical protein